MRYFNLFSNILITKGFGRILISDLQRNSSELYPLEVHTIIEELRSSSIENVLRNYTTESQPIIHEYLDLLLEKEYGFLSDGDWVRSFPALSHQYLQPNEIANLFIEIKKISVLNHIQHSIDMLGIKHLTLFCKESLSLAEFRLIDDLFKGTVLNTIQVLSPFSNTINSEFLSSLDHSTSRIFNLIFYDCKKAPFNTKNKFRFTVTFTNKPLQISSCGKVDLKYFNTHQQKVLEALNHNSCLHKKIGIDIDGNIKNCPLMPESYGNIYHSTLEETLQQPGFKKYWNLTKDYIETCKDCEFRYICTDCRAYTERTHTDANGLDVSKPLKCGYDPYTGKWEAWSKNPLKQKAINFYKNQRLLLEK